MTCLEASIPGAKSIQTEVLMLAFTGHHITMNAQHYCGTFQDLYSAIKRKLPSMLVRGVMLQDNIHPFVAHSVWDTMCSMCWMILDHLMNSLDLSLCCVQPPQKGVKRS
jgi:hypothetical protein